MLPFQPAPFVVAVKKPAISSSLELCCEVCSISLVAQSFSIPSSFHFEDDTYREGSDRQVRDW